jgi:VWFA-related protein
VLDDLHITLDAEKLYRLRQIIVTFLGDLSPADQVAVVYTSRSDLSQDFTSDLATQVHALGRLREGLNARNIAPLGFEHDVRSSLFVLRNVCRSLAGSPHPRRAIVYVGEGITLGFEWDGNPLLRQEVLETFDAARRANVAIYAVDPRGLLTISSIEDVRAQREQKDSLYTLAINTGGLAFVEQSSLPRAAEAIVADNGSFYLLGYYPDPLVRDGKFHDIRVRVKRPGVRVRARQGYVAPDPSARAAKPTPAAPAPNPSEPGLDPALLRGVTVFGVPLRGFAAPIAVGERGRMKTIVSVEVAYPAPDDGAVVADELQYGLLAIDHDARPMASAARRLTFAARPGEARYLIHDVVELPAGPHVIRVGIASRALGKTGTVHIPVSRAGGSRQAGRALARSLSRARSSAATACSRLTEGNCRRNSSRVSPPSR